MANPGHSGARWRQMRAQVLASSDVCYLCGRPGADTVDYLIPYSQGGPMTAANLRPAHAWCNKSKGNRPPRNPTSRDW